jgi:hypothetical protein
MGLTRRSCEMIDTWPELHVNVLGDELKTKFDFFW